MQQAIIFLPLPPHGLLASHAHTITQSHPSIVLCTHNHSITSFCCPLHTQSLHHNLLSLLGLVLLTLHTLHKQSLNHIFQTSHAHTVTQSHPSIVLYTHNHFTSFYPHILEQLRPFFTPNTLHTQSLIHIFQTSHAHTITQSHPSIVLCTHNHSITSF